MTFKLPTLSYAYDALEPVIDATTMEIHHSKHHNAYVTNLNNAVEGTEYADKTIEDLVANWQTLPTNLQNAVRNNGGGHLNHTLFWEQLREPVSDNVIPTEFAEKLAAEFGSVEAFKEKFAQAAATRFGSGWAWLVSKDGKLEVVSTPNQDNPITDNLTVLLGLDVWEHAYYLNYQNRRPDYIKEFFRIINWDVVNARLEHAKNCGCSR